MQTFANPLRLILVVEKKVRRKKILTTNFSGGYFSLDGGGALSQYKPSMVIKNFTIKENHLGPAVGEILS